MGWGDGPFVFLFVVARCIVWAFVSVCMFFSWGFGPVCNGLWAFNEISIWEEKNKNVRLFKNEQGQSLWQLQETKKKKKEESNGVVML